MNKTSQFNTHFNWETLPSNYPSHYDSLENHYGVYTQSALALCDRARICSGARVIDIGCGTGISTEVIVNRTGNNGHVLGLDISEAMLEMARHRRRWPTGTLFAHSSAVKVNEAAFKYGFAGVTDAVISNFVFYYFRPHASRIHQNILKTLRPGGMWVYNITSYLRKFCFGGATFNRFDDILQESLTHVLAEAGYARKPDSSIDQEIERELESENTALHEAGYSHTVIETWELPITPLDAYRFTLNGFYRYGSLPTVRPELCVMDHQTRIRIFTDALEGAASRLNATDERPAIVIISAQK